MANLSCRTRLPSHLGSSSDSCVCVRARVCVLGGGVCCDATPYNTFLSAPLPAFVFFCFFLQQAHTHSHIERQTDTQTTIHTHHTHTRTHTRARASCLLPILYFFSSVGVCKMCKLLYGFVVFTSHHCFFLIVCVLTSPQCA